MPDERVILCLRCGQQNRLNAAARPDLALCGRCQEPLAPPAKPMRRHGWVGLLLILTAGIAGYLVYGYEPQSKLSPATRLSIEEVYGAAPEPHPVAPTVPVPHAKPHSISAHVSCKLTARPPNGTVFLQDDEGPHELIIENGTSADAIVELRDNRNRDIASFYVHSQSTASISSVPEGTFEIFFATGRDYSQECDRFINDFSPWRFPGSQSFESKIEGNFVYSTVMEFTLHEVIRGNISRERIPNSDWFNG